MPDQSPDAASATPTTAPPRRRRWKRWLIILATLGIVLIVAAEIVARKAFQLGDPPLYMADDTIEYRMVPSRTYHRFFVVSTYNQWSMRSPDLEKRKTDPKERRVLVIGDSVVNGGPQTDQSQLATEILRTNFVSAGKPAAVANISCGSWGPPNMLAYLEKFGTFDADTAIIVLNHEDAADVPTFTPLTADFPTRTPTFALEEALFRYIPLYLSSRSTAPTTTRSPAQLEADTQTALAALKKMVERLRTDKVKVAAILHAASPELTGQPFPGTLRLRSTLRELDVPTISDDQAMIEALKSGPTPYRDEIHILPRGQEILASILTDALQIAR